MINQLRNLFTPSVITGSFTWTFLFQSVKAPHIVEYYVAKDEEAMYKEQTSALASALLVGDVAPPMDIDTYPLNATYNLKFPQGALICGSFATRIVSDVVSSTLAPLIVDDIDIYFKSRSDAEDFIKLNDGLLNIDVEGFKTNNMCVYGLFSPGKEKINLIYGVEYTDVHDLLSRFDIRACSCALDPNKNTIHTVRGAVRDIRRREMVFNPVPRAVSLRRYSKYVAKGFTASPYQNLFFAELLRSPIYSQELELLTKSY